MTVESMTSDFGLALIQRLERIPVGRWHVRMRLIIGMATFFDAFDVFAIAFVLPILVESWHLSGVQIGVMISSGYTGQLVGALTFGWIAERFGRIRALVICLLLISGLSLCCALAWNYESLLVFRTLQGLGLGGEVPIAATYLNEFATARRRGRFVLAYQTFFPIGIVAASVAAIWFVPNFGWQSLFIIGAIPALLAVPLQKLLPESPRWLASKGRFVEADNVVRMIEEQSPSGITRDAATINDRPAASTPPARGAWTELFSGIYLKRTATIWFMWFVTAIIGIGISSWMPTIYRTVFKAEIGTALTYGMLANVAALVGLIACALLIDKLGRRACFAGAFFITGSLLMFLWFKPGNAVLVVGVMVVASFFTSSLTQGLYIYASEIYPTRIRAIGTGFGSAAARVGSIFTMPIIGSIVQNSKIDAVFMLLGVAALLGAVVTIAAAVETRGEILERISP